MDLFENPFHILGATQHDNQQRIMELAEEKSLFSDPEEIMAARGVLINPRNRISTEIAWLPGVKPEQIESVLKQLDSPHQSLLNIIGLSPIASANVFTAAFSRLSNIASTNLVEWILAIAHAYEGIDAAEVLRTLNEERNISGFPQITDLSVITAEIQNRRHHYSKKLSSVINNLSITERARLLTLILETVMGNNNNPCPILIDDLIRQYEIEVGDDLKKKQKIIEAQDDKLRVIVDTRSPDATLQPIVNQLIRTLKDWDAIAQPIQLSKMNRGERHDASFEVAWKIQKLAVDLFNDYLKYNIALQFLNILLEVFAEVPEIVERITKDKKDLIKHEHEVKGIELFEEINTQAEKLKETTDAKRPDTTLAPMVTQLIKTLKSWDSSTQPPDANEMVAYTVRSVALHLWNEHQKLDFAIMITNNLIEVFSAVPEIAKYLAEDKKVLDEHARTAQGIKKFEEINTLVKEIKEAADTNKTDNTLTPMVTQLIQTVKTWETSGQPIEANQSVAYTVRGIAIYLWNEHQKLDFAKQITTALIAQFRNVRGMDEVNSKLNEDIVTLNGIKEQQKIQRKQVYTTQPTSGKGSWWIWIILIIIGIVVYAVLQEDFSEDEVKYPVPQREFSENEVIHTDPQEEIPSFNELPMPLPLNGDEETFHNQAEVAPLQIKTPVNSVEHHHFIKIVPAYAENTVKTIFIRSGNTINTKMPLGSYKIKYATGKTWYGTEHLFGPETIYSEADKTFIFARKENGYSGFTIELILQQFGNLRTQRIPKSDW